MSYKSVKEVVTMLQENGFRFDIQDGHPSPFPSSPGHHI